MDPNDQRRLLGNLTSIISDLDVNQVLHHLIQEGILDNRNDQELILNEVTSSKKAAKLIDILLTKGPRAYGIFRNALQNMYPHLVEKLDSWKETVPSDNNNVPGSPLSLLQCAIKENYLQALGQLSPIPWCDWYQLDFKNIYTSLQLVRGVKRSAFHAAVFQEAKCGYSVDVHSIFDPHQECANPKRILIEGDPGIGKSTLCCKIAFDWASKGRLSGSKPTSRNFDLVLFLRACDIVDSIGIYEQIVENLLPEDFELSKEAVKQCLEENQEKTLLILDGYDEISEPSDTIKKLLQGKIMRHVTVLVTSRPKCALPLLKHFDTLLVNRGYNEEKKEELLKKYATELEIPSENAKALKDQVLGNVAVSDMCRNPLNLSVLCLLSAENHDCPMPQTLTGLYQHLYNFLLDKASHRLNMTIEDLEDSCIALQDAAFKALQEKRHHLLDSDFSKKSKIGTILELGFLAKEVKLSKLKVATSYAFTHRSFQEYLSAKHLASLESAQRGEFLMHHLGKGVIDDRVLIFLCGMLETVSDLTESLKMIIGSCHLFSFEPTFADLSMLDVMDNHKCHLTFRIFNEISINLEEVSEIIEKLNVPQVAFSYPWCTGHCLNGFTRLCKARKGKKLDANQKTMLIVSGHALQESFSGYQQLMGSLQDSHCIGSVGFHSIGTLTQLERAMVLASPMKSILFKFLGPVGDRTDALDSLSLQKFPEHLKSLDIIDCSSASVTSTLLNLIPSGPGIQELGVVRCGLDDEGCASLTRKISGCPNLSRFILQENTIHCSRTSAVISIFEALEKLRKLTQFGISSLSSRISQQIFPRPGDVTDKVRPYLKSVLISNPLQNLHIAFCELGEAIFEILTQGLREKGTLESVVIRDCSIAYPPGLDTFLEALQDSNVVNLDLKGSLLQLSNFDSLRQLFATNNTLKKFCLSPVTPDAIHAISEGLALNSSLTELCLFNAGFGDLSLELFATSIQKCSALEKLKLSLSSVPLPPSDLDLLLKSIGKCTKLKKLGLRKFDIGNENISALADVLQASPQIVEVDLHHNRIGPGGAAILLSGLAGRPRLDLLNILDNTLTQSDPEVILLKGRVRQIKVGWF